MLLPLLAFVFGSLIIAAAAIAMMPKPATSIDRRIEELTARAPLTRTPGRGSIR